MIKIKLETEQPAKNGDLWDYPISELDYLLETRNDGESFILYEGRLYEEGNDAYLQSVVDARDILCGYCKENHCDCCQVAKLGNDAEDGVEAEFLWRD